MAVACPTAVSFSKDHALRRKAPPALWRCHRVILLCQTEHVKFPRAKFVGLKKNYCETATSPKLRLNVIKTRYGLAATKRSSVMFLCVCVCWSSLCCFGCLIVFYLSQNFNKASQIDVISSLNLVQKDNDLSKRQRNSSSRTSGIPSKYWSRVSGDGFSCTHGNTDT